MSVSDVQIESAFRIANEQLQALRNSQPIHEGKEMNSIMLRHKHLLNEYNIESRIDDQSIDIMISFKL